MPTVVTPGKRGRPPHPGPGHPEPVKRSLPSWVLFAAVGGAAVLAVAALLAITGVIPGTSTPKPSPSAAATSTPSASPFASFAPADVSAVRTSATQVAVSWRDPNNGQLPQVVSYGSSASPAPLAPVQKGARTTLLDGLSAGTSYCFEVGTVIHVGTPSTLAWSKQVCIPP
jgi:hypothetical protein